MKSCLLLLCFIFTFIACLNKAGIDNTNDIDPENFYYDYKVWAEEGRDDVTVMMQYRLGGEEGTAVALEEPSKVFIDSIELKADSAKLTGIFYELIKPVEEFKGTHTIVFTDRNNKDHKEEFNFQLFALAEEFPEKVKKSPFIIKLKGLNAAPANVRLVITDTSLATLDVNEEMMIKGGEIKVNEQKLAALSKGPVTLEIYTEEERPLKNASKKGGRILITYGLRRQFELVD
jgi:hypothetical protein